jgi:4a-hydroxytetrahydrobiopterin dehydratase
MAFANAVAWVSHAEDHHPEMVIGYNTVKLIYTTHSAGGVTEADLVCAAKVSRLIEL